MHQAQKKGVTFPESPVIKWQNQLVLISFLIKRTIMFSFKYFSLYFVKDSLKYFNLNTSRSLLLLTHLYKYFIFYFSKASSLNFSIVKRIYNELENYFNFKKGSFLKNSILSIKVHLFCISLMHGTLERTVICKMKTNAMYVCDNYLLISLL